MSTSRDGWSVREDSKAGPVAHYMLAAGPVNEEGIWPTLALCASRNIGRVYGKWRLLAGDELFTISYRKCANCFNALPAHRAARRSEAADALIREVGCLPPAEKATR